MSGSTRLPSDLSLPTLRAAYAAGLRPGALVDALLERIEAQGDDHVWIHRAPAGALHARAAEIEALDPALPLYGVPVAVKDNIDVAGMPTTAGCPAYAYVPEVSAPTVDALVAAGALVVGKTNLDQFATGLVGVRSPYGTPRNPVAPGTIPGGSSSGSAVAVAAGLATLGLATDTAGSGRVPAALCGVVGLKPPPGWSSNGGVVPACPSFDCVSVFAPTLDDALAATAVMGHRVGPAPDPDAPLRVGVPAVPDPFVEGERAAAFAATVDRLARRATPEPVAMDPFVEAGSLLYDGALVAERYQAVGAFIEAHPADVLPVTREIILGGGRCTPEQLAADRRRLAVLRERIAPVWDRVEVLAVPTVPRTYTVEEVAADPVRLNATLGRSNQFANLLGLAAVVVPTGTTRAGLPLAVTLVAPPRHEPAMLALAAHLARS
ncbi:MAG TPA: allophanate hydrolase [Iamia sp.]|nr:allophanate hydrolase [Iamia sp.]